MLPSISAVTIGAMSKRKRGGVKAPPTERRPDARCDGHTRSTPSQGEPTADSVARSDSLSELPSDPMSLDGRRKETRLPTVTTYAAIATAVATIVYAIFAGAQWRALKTASETTLRQLQAMEREQRARLSVRGITAPVPLLANQRLTFMVSIANTGRLPAEDIEHRGGFALNPISGLGSDPPYPIPPQTGSFTMGAGDSLQFMSQRAELNANEIEEVRAAKRLLMAYGKFTYRDEIGPLPPRLYCFIYSPEGRWDFCNEHNR
jgi:hypothetical protein